MASQKCYLCIMFRKSPIIGVFLLALFLFPQVHKAVHDLGHLGDFHCLAVTEKHFHEHHDECPVCDYKQPVSESHDLILSVAFIFTFDSLIFTEAAGHLSVSSDYSIPTRGPPAFLI